jgi:hypothetical protein
MRELLATLQDLSCDKAVDCRIVELLACIVLVHTLSWHRVSGIQRLRARSDVLAQERYLLQRV